MPSANTGKIIAEVSAKKRTVDVTFLDGEVLNLPYDVYTQQYFYVGKVLDQKTIDELKVAVALHPLFQYAMRLIQRGKYSEYQVRSKLYAREAKKPQVDAIIERLKLSHLIDDDELVKEWQTYYRQRKYGPVWIEQKLIEKGFSSPRIASIHREGDEEEDYQTIMTLLPVLVKQYHDESYVASQHLIKQRLLHRGFAHRVIDRALSTLPTKDDEGEMKRLQDAYTKVRLRLSKRYQGKILQEKIINFLMRKGYNYANIKRTLKELHHAD